MSLFVYAKILDSMSVDNQKAPLIEILVGFYWSFDDLKEIMR